MRSHHIPGQLETTQRFPVDQQCLCVGNLDILNRQDHRFDFLLDDVGLVKHIRNRRRSLAIVAIDQLMENQEQLEWVRRTDNEVVICVATIIEVESAEAAFIEKRRHDVLDVCVVSMMPGVHEDLGVWPEVLTDQEAGSPIREVGCVKCRLEELVFDQHLDASR